MCGIVGVAHWDGGRVVQPTLRRMLAPLRSEGNEVAAVDGCHSFGAAWLHGADDSMQCMARAPERGLWMALVGRISNLAALGAELCRDGAELPTTAAAVVLQWYMQHGDEAWNKLEGAWSVMLWDERQQTLRLACDRLARQRLFWNASLGHVLVGSHVKSLFTQADCPRDLDYHALRQWLSLGCTLGERTLFADVQQVPAGSVATINQHSATCRKYFQWNFDNAATVRSSEEAAEQLAFALKEGLSLALDGVERAVLPSCSNWPLQVTAELAGQWLSRLDRLSTPKQSARATPIGESFNAASSVALQQAAWHGEMPLVDPAVDRWLGEATAARAAGCRSMLADFGCDELLGGSEVYRATRWRTFMVEHPEWALRARPRTQRQAHFGHEIDARLADDFFSHPHDASSPLWSHAPLWSAAAAQEEYFSDDVRRAWRDCQVFDDAAAVCPAGFDAASWHARAQWLEMSFGLSAQRLAMAAQVYAATGVELCSPFVEQPVIDLACRLPWRFKLRGLEPLIALRRVARWLAIDIDSSKSATAVGPFNQLGDVQPQNEALLDELMSRERLHEDGLFRPEMVMQLAARMQRSETPGPADRRAWRTIVGVQLFVEQFIRNFDGWCDRAEQSSCATFASPSSGV